MTFREVMAELEAMGTEQNRKVYARHGIKGKMFGVSFANLGKLKKKIRVDHGMALELWASGNHDARVLATMVADPARVDGALLDAWAKDLDNYVITDTFTGVAARSAHARKKMDAWVKSKSEWIGRVGWSLVASAARADAELPDELFEEYLGMIESEVHRSKNRVRDAMNSALINIGLRNAELERKAVAAARRIGPVEVDHGETGCKTPDAIAYIEKTKAHYAKKKTAKK